MIGVSEATAFERMGGEAALRQVIDRFVDAVVGDLMIGFHFRGVDIPRLKQREFEFAARHLGAGVRYSGRPMAQAHGPHRILVGQFERRMKILEETLAACGVPAEVQARWLAHDRALRAPITGGRGCEDP